MHLNINQYNNQTRSVLRRETRRAVWTTRLAQNRTRVFAGRCVASISGRRPSTPHKAVITTVKHRDNIWMDCWRDSKVGCYVGEFWEPALAYADDVVLLAENRLCYDKPNYIIPLYSCRTSATALTYRSNALTCCKRFDVDSFIRMDILLFENNIVDRLKSNVLLLLLLEVILSKMVHLTLHFYKRWYIISTQYFVYFFHLCRWIIVAVCLLHCV